MTEDILFDNLYVGHSLEDAKALAAETFDIKKPLEKAADKTPESDEEEDSTSSFQEDPISFIRSKVITFVEAAKEDPVTAFKTQPETGAALAVAFFTFLSMIGALFGLVGSAQKPVVTKVCPLCSVFEDRDCLIIQCSRQKRLKSPSLWPPLLLLAMTRRRKKRMASRSVLLLSKPLSYMLLGRE